MAVTRTRNLKLFITSDLSNEAKANLNIIDSLGGLYLIDSNDVVVIRSKESVSIRANDASIGGTGVGGLIEFGTPSQILDEIKFYTASFKLSDALTLADKATGSTGELKIKYKSDIDGPLDNLSRTLTFDMQGADRNLVLGGNFITSGAFNLTLTATADTDVTLPTTGTLATLAGNETLTNKTIDATNNNISNIANANVAPAAAIDGTKINPDFGAQHLRTTGQYRFANGSNYVYLEAPTLTANTGWKLPAADGVAGQVLKTDGAGNLSWLSVTGASQLAADWLPGDGATKVITHGFASRNVMVQVFDENFEQISVQITRTTINTVTLTSSSAPASTWKVLIVLTE